MRTPVKLNRRFWPAILTAILPSASDPRILSKSDLDEAAFSDGVSTLKFGTTFKTTRKARFPLSIDVLSTLHYRRPPVILDVGASDGITSMDVIKAIPFSRYFVTDAHIDVFCCKHGGRTYFYASDGKCILVANAAWIIYEDAAGALPPFGSIARSFISRAPELPSDATRISLLNSVLNAQLPPNVRVEQYNMFENWPHEKVDLVIAANILNRSYFSENKLVRALGKLTGALNEGGRLAIIENRGIEKATIFRFSGRRASIECRVGGGTEIESLVPS